MDLNDLNQRLRDIAAAEITATGASSFMGKPFRWWDAHTYRCPNDHVSTFLLKSEAQGARVCLACRGLVWLTFPEDVDGPLIDPDPTLDPTQKDLPC